MRYITKICLCLAFAILPMVGGLMAQITTNQTTGAPHTQITNRGFASTDSAERVPHDTLRSARIYSVAMIGTTWWVQAVHNGTDSSWQRINNGVTASNGLNDSSGDIQIGGRVHKPTVDTIPQGPQLGFYFPGNSLGLHPNAWFGQGGTGYNTQNGFVPPLCLCDSLSYVGFNDPFLTMESVDFNGPNGILFLNYQTVADSPQVDIRYFTPTHQSSTLSFDLNGSPDTNPYTSAYDIFFYGDLTGGQGFGMSNSNFAAWHNGPCCFLNPPYGMTFHQDKKFNVLIGPGRDTSIASVVGYAIPYGRLDIRPSPYNTGHIGIFEQDPTDTNKLAGPLVVGSPGVGAVYFPQYTTVQKLAIASPVEGEQVYDITLHMMSYWNGSVWVNH
jgi:hypothetical protein